jgi:Fe-Mn family superoxide dismutase
MSFTLPDLPYDYKSLEPYIDKETMTIHHDKHHAGYVSKLNDAIKGRSELEGKSVEELLGMVENIDEEIRQVVINNGGGHSNHSLFWEIMSPATEKEPEGKLKEAINTTFGSFSSFKEKFSEKALSLFGSGWIFLQADNGKLSLKRHSFQNSPFLHGKVPILGIDVWEHAYYLKYQNRRADYIEAWWNVVNWPKVSELFEKAK